MKIEKYVCPKCENNSYEVDEFVPQVVDFLNCLMYKIADLRLLLVRNVSIQKCIKEQQVI